MRCSSMLEKQTVISLKAVNANLLLLFILYIHFIYSLLFIYPINNIFHLDSIL